MQLYRSRLKKITFYTKIILQVDYYSILKGSQFIQKSVAGYMAKKAIFIVRSLIKY